MNLTALRGIPLIHPGDNLVEILINALDDNSIQLKTGDVLVIAQKIISKAEDRFVHLGEITPSARARELAGITDKDPRLVELVLRESQEVLRAQSGVLIVEHKHGFVCANAGIDHSNVHGDDGGKTDDCVLLLPNDSDASASYIRRELERMKGARIGVAIIDSHGRAWRLGTVGVVIGLAGLPGVVNLRGEKDLFGYKLQASDVGAADELAAAASLVMGQAAEKTPVVHVRGFPYSLRESSLGEIFRPAEMDLFR